MRTLAVTLVTVSTLALAGTAAGRTAIGGGPGPRPSPVRPYMMVVVSPRTGSVMRVPPLVRVPCARAGLFRMVVPPLPARRPHPAHTRPSRGGVLRLACIQRTAAQQAQLAQITVELQRLQAEVAQLRMELQRFRSVAPHRATH